MSGQLAVVYVPRPSKGNLEVGVKQSVWGFSDELMARSNYLEEFRRLAQGDLLFLGYGGPNSRVPAGEWSGPDTRLQAGYLGQIESVEETATDPIWPDGLYPFRLHLDAPALTEGISVANVGADVMEALRLSANQQGRAVVLSLEGSFSPGESGGGALPLTLDGPLDQMVMTMQRREQGKLRKQRLGSALQAECDLCGRDLPVRYLRMAHIKKRSKCSDKEKLDPNNVMTACVECDAFFEAGEIVVDGDGVTGRREKADVTPDLEAVITKVEGRTCAAFNDTSAPYFEFHRDLHADQSA